MSKQQVIIKVGFQTILLPDDQGVAGLIKTLSRGVIGFDRSHKQEFKVTEMCRPSMCYPGKVKMVEEEGSCSDEAREFISSAARLSALPAPKPRQLRLR